MTLEEERIETQRPTRRGLKSPLEGTTQHDFRSYGGEMEGSTSSTSVEEGIQYNVS